MQRDDEKYLRLINTWKPLGTWVGVIAFLLFLGITGCASSRPVPSEVANPIPLPVYQEGTTFIYTNGRWETVEKAGPEGVTWRNHRGHLTSSSADFTYRPTIWKTRTRSGQRSFRTRNDWLGRPAATSLWPLAPGKTARYIESGRWQDDEGKVHTHETQWRLEVVGRFRVKVKAGEFDTWKIVARRFSEGGAYKQSRLREIKTWYYAPAAGHYVKMERNYLGRRPNRSIELVAVTPPGNGMTMSAKSKVRTIFQQALERKRSGMAHRWQLAEHALSGTVTPVATFRLKSGTYCRQYIQQVNQAGEENIFYGLACRTKKGDWEIPLR
jgi:17 kDa outer membrane surface antigen